MFNFFKKEIKSDNVSSFDAIKNALSKTTKTLVSDVISIATGDEKIDEYALEDIETMLIKADLGIDLSVEIIEKVKSKGLRSSQLKQFLKQEFQEILNSAGSNELNYVENSLNIYFVCGVNGAGKTTLIGKLANQFKSSNKKVLLAAADTFRAAAEEQLDIWSKRANVDIVRKDKADSAAVVFEAIDKAKNENYDVLIIDTAGRLQNKFNLVEELKKIKSVIDKKAQDDLRECILVLDANLGQNGLSQANVFNEAVNLTSTALTKLDGSARGGIIFAIAKEYNLPTKLIGIGEKIEDLRSFNKNEFIEALFN